MVPASTAIGELQGWISLFFVDYLRLCFRIGGFPGYEGIDRGIPAEMATLSEGLLEF